AIAPLALALHRPNLQEQALILTCAFAGRAFSRGIEAGTADTQHPAHHPDGKQAGVGFDARVLHSDSCAKYAAAFFRKSRSCFTCSSWRRSRRISSASPVPTPLPGKASSAVRAAARRLFQLCRRSGRMPSSRAICVSGLPPASTRRRASSLNSREYFFRFRVIEHLQPEPYFRLNLVSTGSGEVQLPIIPVAHSP